MGQGLAHGVGAGFLTSSSMVFSFNMGVTDIAFWSAVGGMAGLAADFTSDMVAKTGKVAIDREAVLHASENLRHVYSFYSTNSCYAISKALRQKHEWIVVESESRRFYAIQKCPISGDIRMDTRLTLRSANDCGLRVANMPTQTGEIRLQRIDQEFDLADDLQVAYVIAWLRKEDPRWSFLTENSRHFTTKLRKALNDF